MDTKCGNEMMNDGAWLTRPFYNGELVLYLHLFFYLKTDWDFRGQLKMKTPFFFGYKLKMKTLYNKKNENCFMGLPQSFHIPFYNSLY